MSNFTFLTYEQVFGSSQLEVIKEYGTQCAMSDFAVLLGGYASKNAYYLKKGYSWKVKTGSWWTKTCGEDNDALMVGFDGWNYFNEAYDRTCGARPALPLSSIPKVSLNIETSTDGIKEIKYGEYPQSVVGFNCSLELERMYKSNILKTTGKNYTTDAIKYSDYNQEMDPSFKAKTYPEYEYDGNKYIRFISDTNCIGKELFGGIIKVGQVFWVKVEPIIWLVDEQANLVLSKKIIFSGVQFRHSKNQEMNFDKTDIKLFMDNYFSKEIISDMVYTQDMQEEKNGVVEETKTPMVLRLKRY